LSIVRLARLSISLVLLAAAASAQQTPPPEQAVPAPPGPYPLAEVTLRAEETRSELREVARRVAPSPAVGTLTERLPANQRLVSDAARRTRQLLRQQAPSLRLLGDLEREWRTRQESAETWHQLLTRRAAALDAEAARLAVLRERWQATRTAAEEAPGSPALPVIDGVLTAIDEVGQTVRERARALTEPRRRVQAASETIATAIEQVAEARGRHRGNLLTRDAPAVWNLRPARDIAGVREQIREDFERDVEALRAYLELHGDPVLQHLVLFLAVLVAAVLLRRRAGRWSEDPALSDAAVVFRYPVSVALLVALTLDETFHPFAPSLLSELVGAALLIPAVRLLPALIDRGGRPLVYGLAAFYVLAMARELLDAAPFLPRLIFTVETLAAGGLVLWLLKPSRLESLPSAVRLPRALAIGMRLLLLLIVVALLANLVGYVAFASLLGTGMLGSVYAAVILYGGYRVFRVFLALALRSRVASGLRSVRVGRASIERVGGRVIGIAATLGWLGSTLEAFSIRQNVVQAARAVLGTPATLGSVSISLGDVLAFGVTIWAAFLASRAIRFVLEEEVFPRVVLRRGIPNAISSSVRYGVLFVGFLFAASAAGFDMSRVTLLAGAFGVGIGFGLQNVVNNFVSGLILLFERPIQVGDTIELGGVLGDVRQIGIRASTVRTVDGAEVIVPNGNLISDSVVNWTLSDRRRRVTVSVGVEYGTDPARVIEILDRVAQEEPSVLDDPPPLALFEGFGDSSLDFQLRCWIPRFEEGFVLRSALATRIYAALNEAGIGIPFPQRDLHLRSVDAKAAGGLRGGGLEAHHRDEGE
jgi:small-conductance mechanosensitive channel